jgi:hypothetical protein
MSDPAVTGASIYPSVHRVGDHDRPALAHYLAHQARDEGASRSLR